jgi:hypothetical protein
VEIQRRNILKNGANSSDRNNFKELQLQWSIKKIDFLFDGNNHVDDAGKNMDLHCKVSSLLSFLCETPSGDT